MGVLPDRLGRLRDRRRPARGQVVEELLDRLPSLAGPLLNPADELVDVAALHLKVVVGQLTPPLLHLTPELVPLALQLLCVDRHRRGTPLFLWLGSPAPHGAGR